MNSANCDLYDKIFLNIRVKQIELSVRWMPSHLGKEASSERPPDVSHFDVLANDKADFYAGLAASFSKFLRRLPIELLATSTKLLAYKNVMLLSL